MPALNVRALLKQAREDKAKAGLGSSIFDAAGSKAAESIRARVTQQNAVQSTEHASASGRPVLEDVLYLPDIVTEEEEANLLKAIEAAPADRWIQAGERQMQNWGGRPGEALVRERLPPFLQALVDLLVAAEVYQQEQAPQHVLINCYKGGAGIGAHMDGPLYAACVATITLGGPALMTFHETTPDGLAGAKAAEVLLQPRGLLVMRNKACSAVLHSIANQQADIITDACLNIEAAKVHVGQLIPRSSRRMSLVFVHKQNAKWIC